LILVALSSYPPYGRGKSEYVYSTRLTFPTRIQGKSKRSHKKQPNATLDDYIENLEANRMTGNWKPIGDWMDVHGDCKSRTGGRWVMRTMTTTSGEYKVMVVKGRTVLRELDYSSEPTFETIVTDLKAGLGKKLD
jgi:hypothetical protein